MTDDKDREGCPADGALPFRTVRAALLTVILFSLIAMFFFPVMVLEVNVAGEEKVAKTLRVRPGETFYLQYLHSVEKTAVRDCFRVDYEGRMVLYETAFYSNNTGMATHLEEGEHLSLSGGVIRITGRNRVMADIVLRVSEASANTLVMESGLLYLPCVVREGAVAVSVRRLSLGSYLQRLWCGR